MNRVIKDYSKLPADLQEEVYVEYSERGLERTSFPYKGNITDGVIFKGDDVIYLIPISTIIAGRSGSSDDLDDDDDDQSSDDDVDMDVEVDESDEE